mmetsp:Transcript_1814/g.4636  ORF Transcript_1814/g.4636 Transcript_1814/m.4636 type:complete len:302 (-) Transcript_1814:743-1648(-)
MVERLTTTPAVTTACRTQPEDLCQGRTYTGSTDLCRHPMRSTPGHTRPTCMPTCSRPPGCSRRPGPICSRRPGSTCKPPGNTLAACQAACKAACPAAAPGHTRPRCMPPGNSSNSTRPTCMPPRIMPRRQRRTETAHTRDPPLRRTLPEDLHREDRMVAARSSHTWSICGRPTPIARAMRRRESTAWRPITGARRTALGAATAATARRACASATTARKTHGRPTTYRRRCPSARRSTFPPAGRTSASLGLPQRPKIRFLALRGTTSATARLLAFTRSWISPLAWRSGVALTRSSCPQYARA